MFIYLFNNFILQRPARDFCHLWLFVSVLLITSRDRTSQTVSFVHWIVIGHKLGSFCSLTQYFILCNTWCYIDGLNFFFGNLVHVILSLIFSYIFLLSCQERVLAQYATWDEKLHFLPLRVSWQCVYSLIAELLQLAAVTRDELHSNINTAEYRWITIECVREPKCSKYVYSTTKSSLHCQDKNQLRANVSVTYTNMTRYIWHLCANMTELYLHVHQQELFPQNTT